MNIPQTKEFTRRAEFKPEDDSLRKLIRQWNVWKEAYLKGQMDDAVNKKFLEDLQDYEYLRKRLEQTRDGLSRSSERTQQQCEDIERDSQRKLGEISSLQARVMTARAERENEEQYHVLVKQVHEHGSPKELEQTLARLNAQIQGHEARLQRLDEAIEYRRRQNEIAAAAVADCMAPLPSHLLPNQANITPDVPPATPLSPPGDSGAGVQMLPHPGHADAPPTPARDTGAAGMEIETGAR
ncbi:hypothetical protein PAPYR_10204 [Paratrimastix pyriformis]|uniref:Uncharacterized protein n=1 Tax=Paratrimastix pyriformis TaxID=342808 RepID=A0ABQ8U6G9_9EUKA|nr:hypothetical protein PAPYR_10204 [Paratrimastix pyriformis]